MTRIGRTFGGALLILGLALGPAAGSAAATISPGPVVLTGWPCHPNGSGVVTGPTTTNSLAVLVPGVPAADSISCTFMGLGPTAPTSRGVTSGGDCYFHEGDGIGIEFAHRLFIVEGTFAQLVCWDGSQVPG
jgi:hypothetical protein